MLHPQQIFPPHWVVEELLRLFIYDVLGDALVPYKHGVQQKQARRNDANDHANSS